jgi:hypothetical protein
MVAKETGYTFPLRFLSRLAVMSIYPAVLRTSSEELLTLLISCFLAKHIFAP